MKLNIPVIACLCLSLLGSQELNAKRNLIKMRPESTQGFLVLDKDADASISSWKIDIYKDPADGTASASAPAPEVTYTLENKNYQLIPSEFYQPGPYTYSYTITGYNSKDEPVVSQGPEFLCAGCPPSNMEELGKWTCDGKTYAWVVKLWRDRNPPKNYFLIFGQAVDFSTSGIQIPYYQWGTSAFLNSICGTDSTFPSIPMLEYYGLASNDCYTVNENNKIITRNSMYPYYLRDHECAKLYGSVFGVQKSLGNWHTAGGKMVNLGSATPATGTSMSEMLNYIRIHDIFEFGDDNALSCSPCGGSVTGWTNGGWATSYIEANKIWTSGVGCEFELWCTIGKISELAEGKPMNINEDLQWYSGLVAVQISRIDEEEKSISLERDKLFDETGRFIAPPMMLSEGLYSFEFVHEKHAGLPFYLDVKTATDYSLKQKDLFEATIYPVPITSSAFKIDMKAYAQLDVTYSLYNPSMSLVRTEVFNLPKDYTGTKTIRIPYVSGNYTHVFTFPDGSVQSFITPRESSFD
ncbi:MAG: hypothetical protein JNL13_08535 [Chitinophagaceae bacterium]|nr:hypothetical protein [Chitinophagaceae bacterium]